MYLLDTNVVSELRRPKPHARVIAWLGAIPDEQLFIAAVTLAELQRGIEITREQDAEKAAAIEAWVDQLGLTHSILPMDGTIFRAWARLMHRRSDALLEGAMIAATASVHNLTVVTRNLRDFAPFAIRTLDPFAARS